MIVIKVGILVDRVVGVLDSKTLIFLPVINISRKFCQKMHL